MPLILLIDDDPLIADLVRTRLGNAGYTVGVLNDGRVALEVIEFKRPALVLLDCAMPFVPGIEVLRQVRSSRVCFGVPVLMLTARGQSADRDIAMRAGASGYMCKPLNLELLTFKIEEMIGDRRQSAPPAQRYGQVR